MLTLGRESSVLTKLKDTLKADHSNKLFGFYLGLASIIVFLAFVSLFPQISEKLGNLAQKKESQETFAAVAPPCSQYGDVDGDSSVTSNDTVLIGRYVGGLSTSVVFTDEVKKRADVNGNLKVDSDDRLLILNFVSGIHITFPVCVDRDTDGYTDAVENYVGTDPYKSCGTGAWPADLNNDKRVNSLDGMTYFYPVRRLNTDPVIATTGTYDKRWDTVPGKAKFLPSEPNSTLDINIGDYNSVVYVTPPMFNGARAYGGPACTITDPPQTVFEVSPASIMTGSAVKISWSAPRAVAPCDATSSPQLGSWRGQKKTSGDESITVNTAGTYTFTLTCYGAGGKTAAPAKTVTAITPCSGTPVLEVRPLEVEKGQNIVLFASGMSNCTSKDVIKFESTKGTQVWDKPLVNCTLASGNNCSAIFTADWNPGGPYSVRALIDRNGDGSTDGMSNVVNIQVKAPPPPCNGTPTVSVSATIINPDSTVTAIGSGVSSCSSLDTMHFVISSNGSDWVGLSPFCNLANGSSCASQSAVMYGLPNYVGGHVYKVKAVLQKSNGQRIDSAPVDLIVKIPNTWGGSKYPPPSGGLPSPEEALRNYSDHMAIQEPDQAPSPSREILGPFPTEDFIRATLPLYLLGTDHGQRNKFDLRMVNFMKSCGYNIEISSPREDWFEHTDAFLIEGEKRIRIDFKAVQNQLGALESYNMPRLSDGKFDRSWGERNGLTPGSSNWLASKLEKTVETINAVGYGAIVLLADATTDYSDPLLGAENEKKGYHNKIDPKMTCQRVAQLLAKAKEAYKPEIDSGKVYKSLQTSILEQAAMQRWGGPGYVPIPFTNSVNISSLSQIVPGKTNNLKLAEPDKGGGLFPNLDLNISRPSLSDVAKAAAGAATGGASTWVIVNGARAANGVGYAAGFAVGMTEDTYNSLYCGYSDPNQTCQN